MKVFNKYKPIKCTCGSNMPYNPVYDWYACPFNPDGKKDHTRPIDFITREWTSRRE